MRHSYPAPESSKGQLLLPGQKQTFREYLTGEAYHRRLQNLKLAGIHVEGFGVGRHTAEWWIQYRAIQNPKWLHTNEPVNPSSPEEAGSRDVDF